MYYTHTYREKERGEKTEESDWISLLIEFYGVSTFVGYLMPNPFLRK